MESLFSLNLPSFMPMSKFSKMNHHHIFHLYHQNTELCLEHSTNRWRAPAPIPAAGSDHAQQQRENVPLHPGAQLVLWNPDSSPASTNAPPLPAGKMSFFSRHFGEEIVCRDADTSHSLLLCPSGLRWIWSPVGHTLITI